MAKPVIALLLVTAACASSPPAAPVKPAPRSGPDPMYVIGDLAVGPIRGDSRGTLVGLRALLPGLEVKPVYDGAVEYHVARDGEELYYVIPGDDGGVFNVHITSSKLGAPAHPWRAGQPFSGAATLTACECWGDQPVCYKTGEHVAVSFKRACDGIENADGRAWQVLDGVAVQRMIWSPTPFGATKQKDAGASGTEDDPPPPLDVDDETP